MELIAVCAYIFENNRILGVSRRHNHKDFGLPGGRIDPGEEPIEALIREVEEETGLKLDGDLFHPIYEAVDVYGNLTRTYAYRGPISDFIEGVHEDNGGYAKWCSHQELLEGTFTDYNKGLFTALENSTNN